MLTKEDKIKIYQGALTYLQELDSNRAFMCNALGWAMFNCGFSKNGGNDLITKENFPEFWNLKPENSSYTWFDNSEYSKRKRIEIIQSILNNLIKI